MTAPWKMFIFLLLNIFLMAHGSPSSLQCRDENDKPVDWFVAIKLPRLKKSENINIRKGEAYVFITSNSDSKNWTLSARTVSDLDSIMGRTLKPIYNGQASKFARILYNDEPPHGNTTMTLGHTKGVAVGDAGSGFWLIHSVPHYPPEASSSTYSYPSTGLMYGQSFLCITVQPTALETIGKQLMFNEPDIYDAEVPETLSSILPSFTRAANGERVHTSPWFNAATFTSAGGKNFTSFAKSKQFGKDLYADWVAQDLRTSLLVETWNHGSKMQSECNKPFKVENVAGMSLDSISFRTGEDHSKWAVSSDNDKPWVCVGDINRTEHQKQRGGGTVCMQNTELRYSYHASVTNLDVCPAGVVLVSQNQSLK